MGILNVTPDSFSDGGDHLDPAAAIAAGHRMVADGAAILDIGGETTRPGSTPTPPAEEQRRILPVIAGLRDAGVPISVDTRNAATMAAALDEGAAIVNDVSGLSHDPAAAALLARRGCPVILMHMRGTPETMNGLAQYGDVAADIARELAATVAWAGQAGIARDQIALDPGIGFAKIGEQNIALLRGLPHLTALGFPLVVGVSRKRFIGTLTGRAAAKQRDAGSLAAGLFALRQGARILRVHDVAATVDAVRVWHALAG
jgi:dihydropteroate synthase